VRVQEPDRSSTALLTVEQVAKQLNCGRTWAWELCASGRLPTIRLGRLVRVRPADLQRFIDHLAGDDYPAEDSAGTVARPGQRCGQRRIPA
jgi:excisionase family DNA binding protein